MSFEGTGDRDSGHAHRPRDDVWNNEATGPAPSNLRTQ